METACHEGGELSHKSLSASLHYYSGASSIAIMGHALGKSRVEVFRLPQNLGSRLASAQKQPEASADRAHWPQRCKVI